MFKRVAFRRAHLEKMLSQPANADAPGFFANVNLEAVEKLPSFTGIYRDEPAVCGGIVPYWTGRGYLWTIFNEDFKQSFVPIYRGIKAFLEEIRPQYNRLEIAVPYGFTLGVRRAKMLGFQVECEHAVKFLPDGTDAHLLVLFGGR